MDISTTDTSGPRARQLRDEPQSGRSSIRGYQQRQPSLERGVADRTDLTTEEPGKSVLRGRLKTPTWDGSAHLTEDSHINDQRSPAAAQVLSRPSGATRC